MRGTLPRLAAALCALSSVSIGLASLQEEDAEAFVQVAASLVQTGRDADGQSLAAAPVCTRQELEDYQERVSAGLRREAEKWHNISEAAKAAVAPHLAPLSEAGQLARGLILEQAVKPATIEVARHILQMVARPKGPRAPLQVPDLRRTAADFWQLYGRASIQASSVMLKGLTALDGSLNEVVQSHYRDLEGLPDLNRSLPRRDTELLPYLLGKVMPIISLEIWPELATALRLLAHVPKNEKELPGYFAGAVAPFLAAQMPRLLTLRPEIPARRCVTCQERYVALTYGGEDRASCSARCLPTLVACGGGLTGDCLGKLGPCFHCHGERLDELNACEGRGPGAVSQRLSGVAGLLEDTNFADPAAVDHFMDTIAYAAVR